MANKRLKLRKIASKLWQIEVLMRRLKLERRHNAK
jgi:hypothetical protein